MTQVAPDLGRTEDRHAPLLEVDAVSKSYPGVRALHEGERMILIRGLTRVITFDDQERELEDADILIDGPKIVAVGKDLSDRSVSRTIDGRGMIALPGLINSHQHLFEGAMRAIPQLERVTMASWLEGVLTRSAGWWRDGKFGPDVIREVARAVLLQSLLGGITTVADQHLFFPGATADSYIDATIEAATDLGIRFHAARSSMTLGKSEGGFCDDLFVEPVDRVVQHCLGLIDQYHEPEPFGMVRIALGPCGVPYDKPELFEAFAQMAADYDVRLHTHFYEPLDAGMSDHLYGMTPWRFLEKHGWASDRVWLAHAVVPPREEIPEFADAGVAIAHLIAADLRMGWGLAPIREYLDAGITVGFGTTGSASNEGGNLLGDLRLAALAHRPADPNEPEKWLSARELLRMATRGSAECLGRPDLGVLEEGRAADIACWRLDGVDRVGVHDPAIGLIMTGLSDRASLVVVNGQVLVENERPVLADLERIVANTTALIPKNL